MDIKKHVVTIGGYVSLVITLLIAYILYNNAVRTMNVLVPSTEMYYVIMLLIFINSLFAMKSQNYFITYIAFLMSFFAWLSFADVSYSIDEAMNFENINHIIKYHTIYTFNDEVDYLYLNEANDGFNSIVGGANYEAVQAPLYYIFFAIIGCLISNAYIRFHIFRIISLLCVLVIFYFVHKTVSFLESKDYLIIDGQIYRISLVLTIFNPGYLYRASRLNNEMLVCVLMSILIYCAVKCTVNGYSKKYYWILSIISSALFLTKYTAIYAYIILGIIVIYQKRIREAIMPVCAGALCVVPWFAYNIKTYGSLTGMQKHLDYVIPIVNPQKINIDIFDAFFSLLPITFFSGEEFPCASGEATWLGCFWMIVMFIIINEAIILVKKIKNNRGNINEFDTKYIINVLFVALLISVILCLTVGTISTKVCSIRGRYIYAPSIVIIFLFLFHNDKLPKNIKNYFIIFAVVIISIAETRCITTSTDRVFKNEKIYASKMQELKLYDLTDDNWKHGVGRQMPCLLVENDGSNYSVLIGRYITIPSGECGGGVLIQSVQEEGEYIWLTLNKLIDVTNIDSNVMTLNSMFEETYINASATITESNVEGQEICQELKARKSGEIIGFEVMLGTYFDENYDALVNYKVLDNKNAVLTEGAWTLVNIVDNTYVSLYFEKPISLQKGEKFSLCFTIENEFDKPIALYLSENDNMEDTLYLNGNKLIGKNVALNLWTNWKR